MEATASPLVPVASGVCRRVCQSQEVIDRWLVSEWERGERGGRSDSQLDRFIQDCEAEAGLVDTIPVAHASYERPATRCSPRCGSEDHVDCTSGTSLGRAMSGDAVVVARKAKKLGGEHRYVNHGCKVG